MDVQCFVCVGIVGFGQCDYCIGIDGVVFEVVFDYG